MKRKKRANGAQWAGPTGTTLISESSIGASAFAPCLWSSCWWPTYPPRTTIHTTFSSTHTLEAVEGESLQYGDIIQEGFVDSYNNLTLKSVMLLKWVATRCPGVRFVMKTDDDMFVNLATLVRFLGARGGTRGLLVGSLICGARPIADPQSKWYAPRYMYSSRVYPNYLSGTGYVMSADVATRLYKASLATPLFHLEDVYLTGICSRVAGVRPRDNAAFTFGRRRLDACAYRSSAVITSHRLLPAELRRVWADMANPRLDCTRPPTTPPGAPGRAKHKNNFRKQVNKCV